MHGYHENCFQQTLIERGFMKNGLKRWLSEEYGNKYTDPDELVKQVEQWHEIGDKSEEGHYLKTPVHSTRRMCSISKMMRSLFTLLYYRL